MEIDTIGGLLGVTGIFLVAFIIHELGHAVAYYHFKKRWLPIHLRWWGLQVGSQLDLRLMKPKEDFWVRSGGILAGYFTLAILMFFSPYMADSLDIILIYLIGCFWDFAQMDKILNMPKDRLDWRYDEFKVVRVRDD